MTEIDFTADFQLFLIYLHVFIFLFYFFFYLLKKSLDLIDSSLDLQIYGMYAYV